MSLTLTTNNILITRKMGTPETTRMHLSNSPSSSSLVSTSSTATSSVIMSTSSQMTLKSTRKGHEVRSRLLNNLGVFKPPTGSTLNMTPTDPAIARKINILRGMGLGGMIPPQPLQVSSHHSPVATVDSGETVSKLALSAMTTEPLKYKKDPLVSSTSASSNATTNLNKGSLLDRSTRSGVSEKNTSKRRIQFKDSVSVVPIPMRSEYSDRVRARLWSDRYEIHEMASRNAIEFSAEGWDWKNVIEDDGMFVCTASGELIHPVHCQR